MAVSLNYISMMSCTYHSIKIEVERLEKYCNVVRTAFNDLSEQKCCSWVKMQFRSAVNQKTLHNKIFTAFPHFKSSSAQRIHSIDDLLRLSFS